MWNYWEVMPCEFSAALTVDLLSADQTASGHHVTFKVKFRVKGFGRMKKAKRPNGTR
jgi:hypothetical protein